jgi:hypothetical protein
MTRTTPNAAMRARRDTLPRAGRVEPRVSVAGVGGVQDRAPRRRDRTHIVPPPRELGA